METTVLAMAIDPDTVSYRLGSARRGGGLSGPAIHPIAVRAVHDVHAALPDLPIVGVGGISSGLDAAELILAGAHAVQVGTATFADPRAPMRVLAELADWAADGVRGEITVVVAGAAPTMTSLEEALPGIRERAARGERLKEVCADVAVTTGLSKKALYDAAVSDKTGVAPASPRL
jgi:tRNA-dihydrouridine synthase